MNEVVDGLRGLCNKVRLIEKLINQIQFSSTWLLPGKQRPGNTILWRNAKVNAELNCIGNSLFSRQSQDAVASRNLVQSERVIEIKF